MPAKLTRYFTDSAAALLAAFATALFVCNVASAKLALPHDPLFALSLRTFFWILGGGAITIMLACIFLRQPGLKLALILWFAANLVIYRIGVQWQGMHAGAYVGTLSHTFNLSNGVTGGLLNLLFLYLFTASAALLVWNFIARPEAAANQPSPDGRIQVDPPAAVPSPGKGGRSQAVFVRTLKISCTVCGGHIEFPTNFFGERIPCPHCQAIITLQKARNLKMACSACEGHLEFPDHALGQTIPCPHCQEAITLKEPA